MPIVCVYIFEQLWLAALSQWPSWAVCPSCVTTSPLTSHCTGEAPAAGPRMPSPSCSEACALLMPPFWGEKHLDFLLSNVKQQLVSSKVNGAVRYKCSWSSYSFLDSTASLTAMSPSCSSSFPMQRGLHKSWHSAPEAHVLCVAIPLPSCSTHSHTFSTSGAQFQGKQSSECPGFFSMLLRKIGVFRTWELCWHTVCWIQCHYQKFPDLVVNFMTLSGRLQIEDLIFCFGQYFFNLVANFSKTFQACPMLVSYKTVKQGGWEPSSATPGCEQCWKQDAWQKWILALNHCGFSNEICLPPASL